MGRANYLAVFLLFVSFTCNEFVFAESGWQTIWQYFYYSYHLPVMNLFLPSLAGNESKCRRPLLIVMVLPDSRAVQVRRS